MNDRAPDTHQCNCSIRELDEETRFTIRYGAHEKFCAIYRPSLDPVDRIHDEAARAFMDADRQTRQPEVQIVMTTTTTRPTDLERLANRILSTGTRDLRRSVLCGTDEEGAPFEMALAAFLDDVEALASTDAAVTVRTLDQWFATQADAARRYRASDDLLSELLHRAYSQWPEPSRDRALAVRDAYCVVALESLAFWTNVYRREGRPSGDETTRLDLAYEVGSVTSTFAARIGDYIDALLRAERQYAERED